MGLGFRVQDLAFRVQGLRFRRRHEDPQIIEVDGKMQGVKYRGRSIDGGPVF